MTDEAKPLSYGGMYAYVIGYRGRALLRILEAEEGAASADSRPFLFIDRAEVIAGHIDIPVAFRLDDVTLSDNIEIPRQSFITAMSHERESMYAEIDAINRTISMAKEYDENARANA